MKLCIVILAAGESSRLGYPKQSLVFQGKTLIQRAIETAREVINSEDILVMLGGYRKEIETLLPNDIAFLINPNWNQGMGSTISCATNHVASKSYDAILFIPSDLPLLDNTDLQRIIDKASNTNHLIIGSSFDGGIGIPVLFKSELFNELTEIEPSVGAKNIIVNNKSVLELVEVANAAFDIDTQEDVDKLLSS